MYCVLCLDPSTRYPISTFQYTATLLRIITTWCFSLLFDDTSGSILAAPQLARQSATVGRPSADVVIGRKWWPITQDDFGHFGVLLTTTNKGTWRTCTGDFSSNEHVVLWDNLWKLELIFADKSRLTLSVEYCLLAGFNERPTLTSLYLGNGK